MMGIIINNPDSNSGGIGGTLGVVDNAVTRADGTGGSTAQGSPVTIDDSGSVNLPSGQAYKINGTALAKGDVGLGNVDNTSDANKPVSTATQTALNLKENVANIPLDTIGLLNTVNSVDLNTTSATTLYTCPAGKSCIIHRVVVYNASTSLTTASYAFGWTSPNYNDLVANATHTELTGATLFTIMNAKSGAKIGVAGDLFRIKPTIAQGSAASVSIQVFGTLY